MFNNINSFVFWIESLKKADFEYSLERINKLDEIYGFPSKGIKYIHVAGTNGKGSVTKAIKNILYKKGYNVGLYSSPYVLKFNERLSYNNRYISDNELLKIGNRLYDKIEDIRKVMPLPTFFELMTIGAFMYFKDMNVDIAVLEVGMGGLLDATNIITPLVSVITSVSYDHIDVLGNTIEEIQTNKLGIVKRNVPFVGIPDSKYLYMYEDKSLSMNSCFYRVDKTDITDIDIENFKTKFKYKNISYSTSLIGVHQAENMSVVIETMNVLNTYYDFNIDYNDILIGLEDVYIEGRMQVINKCPIMIVDGAHNPDGIKRLTENMQILKGKKKLVTIVAISKNKDKEQMLKDIIKVSDEIFISEYNYKRSTSIDELESIAKNINKLGKVNIKHIDNIEDVYNELDSEKIYLFCGSLYFAGDVLLSWINRIKK